MTVADDVDSNSKHLQMLSAELSCATRIISLLIRLWLSLCPADVTALDAVLTPVVNDAKKQVEFVTLAICQTHRHLFSLCRVNR